MIEAKINLRNFIVDIIRNNINSVGLVECGRLKYQVDLHIAAANSQNVYFYPSEILDNGDLIVKFDNPYTNKIDEILVNIPAVIEQQEKGEDNEKI